MPLHDLLGPGVRAGSGINLIEAALDTVRRHLGMEVAYLSEFVGERTVFRAVSAPGLGHLIRAGDSRPLSEVYCLHILEGRLPRLIPDTAREPLAQALPITRAVPIGSHASVPVHRTDGSVYGMFCCLSPRPNASLTDRDLAVLELFAGLAAGEVNTALSQRARRDALLEGTRAALAPGGLTIHLQPIRDLATLAATGVEALARFPGDPPPRPDHRFAEAAEVGLGEALEAAAIAEALVWLPRLPPPLTLSVNAGPALVVSGALRRLLLGQDLRRLVVEITEHDDTPDPDHLAFELDPLRDRGLLVAVDDAGAGHSGLGRILVLAPDVIKLDRELIRGVVGDHARASLVEAMVSFARRTGATLVAEGIETAEELATLRGLGVDRGQGWHLGRPAPPEQALAQLALPGAGRDASA